MAVLAKHETIIDCHPKLPSGKTNVILTDVAQKAVDMPPAPLWWLPGNITIHYLCGDHLADARCTDVTATHTSANKKLSRRRPTALASVHPREFKHKLRTGTTPRILISGMRRKLNKEAFCTKIQYVATRWPQHTNAHSL